MTTCGGCGEPLHEPNEDCWWIDLGRCPYFRGIEPRLCIFGCVDEPECQTYRPDGGWPSERSEDMTLTGSDVETMRIELGDQVVESVIRGETTLTEAQLKVAFVAGFEHGADGEKPRLEGPGVSTDELRAFRAGVVAGRTAARDGLLDEVTRAGYRQVAVNDEYRAWCELEAGEV
jgi:hypothetical protein